MIVDNMKIAEEDKVRASAGGLLKLISLLGFASAFFAGAFNLAFFIQINPALFPLLSLSDHLVVALPVFPIVFLGATIAFLFDPPWADDEKSSIEWKLNKEWIERPTWQKNAIFLLIAAFIFFYVYFETPKGNYSWYIPSILMVIVCVEHTLLERSGIKDIFAPVFKWGNIFVSGALISFVMGLNAGYAAVNDDNTHTTKIILADGGSIEGTLLGTFPSGIIFKNEGEKGATYYRADGIRSIFSESMLGKDVVQDILLKACTTIFIPQDTCSSLLKKKS